MCNFTILWISVISPFLSTARPSPLSWQRSTAAGETDTAGGYWSVKPPQHLGRYVLTLIKYSPFPPSVVPQPGGRGARPPEAYCIISSLACFGLFSKVSQPDVSERGKRRRRCRFISQPPMLRRASLNTEEGFLAKAGSDICESNSTHARPPKIKPGAGPQRGGRWKSTLHQTCSYSRCTCRSLYKWCDELDLVWSLETISIQIRLNCVASCPRLQQQQHGIVHQFFCISEVPWMQHHSSHVL